MSRKLSAAAIPTLPAGEYFDSVVSGLTLRVGANRRTWQYRYRTGGRNPRIKLGHFPQLGLAEARAAARTVIERVDSGAPLPAAEPHPRSSSILTLGVALDRYVAFRRQEGRRIKTLSTSTAMLRAELKPWLNLPLESFGKAELRQARDTVVDRGALIGANRLLSCIGPFLRWCAQEDLIEHNFTPDIRRPAAERKRERVLKPAELRAIWQATLTLNRGRSSRAYGRLIRFLMVTGQRRGEGATLRYGDILDGTWRQAAEDNKSARTHTLKLPPLALEIVGQGEPFDPVFCGISGCMGGWEKLKRTLDEECGFSVSGWRLHDLRRTAASGMQDLGIAHDTIERVLNHAVPGVAGHYLHGQLETLKAEALSRWADELQRIVNQPTVVPLAAKRR